MHANILIASSFFMVLLVFFTLGVMFLRRVKAIRSGAVRVRHFKTYETESQMPQKLVQASRHYKNLFEMPPLFHVAVLLVLGLQLQDGVVSALAVLYCSFRLVHTVIHLGANNVLHRMKFFGASCLVLFTMWLYIIGKTFL
ncbi:MAG: MAPEG family protein [Bacteriovoracaceae bacterium]